MTGLAGLLRRDPPAISCPSCQHRNVGATVRWCGWCGHALDLHEHDTERHRRPIEQRGRQGRTIAVGAIAGLALLGLATASVLRSAPTSPRGLTARGDAARTGQVGLSTVDSPTEVAWTADLDVAPTPAEVDQHVAVGETLVATVRNNAVTALDASSGIVNWTHDLGNGAVQARGVAVLDVGIAVSVVVLRDGVGAPQAAQTGILLLDRDTGDIVDRRSSDGRPYALTVPTLTPIIGQADILIQADDRHIQATSFGGGPAWDTDLNATLNASVVGLVAMRRETIVAVASRPVGVVLQSNVAAGNALLVGLDVASGAIRWAREYPASMPFTPIAVDDTHVLVGGTTVLDGVDIETGAVTQRYPRPAGVVTGLALTSATAIYALDDGTVGAYDRQTMQDSWRMPASSRPSPGHGVVTLPDDSVLGFDRSRAGDAFRLDGRTGAVLGVVGVGARASTAASDRLLVVDDGALTLALDPDGTTRWRTALPPPAVVGLATDGAIVVVQAPDGTAIVDGRTGERLASIRRGFGQFPADRQGGPVVTDGTTTVVSPLSFDGARAGLVAIDSLSGVGRWSREGDAPTAEGPLTLDGGVVWVPVGDEVHGYAIADGRRAYAARGGLPRGPLAVDRDRIIAPAAYDSDADVARGPERQVQPPDIEPDVGASLVALSRTTRRPVWSADTGGCGVASIVDDLVVVPTPDGVVARELAGGTVIWSQVAARGACTPLAIGRGTVVHVRGRVVTALDVASGAVRWSATVAAVPATVPVTIGDEVVYADASGTLQSLALRDGEPRWQFGLPAPAAAAPIVVADRLVVLLTDGRLVGLR